MNVDISLIIISFCSASSLVYLIYLKHKIYDLEIKLIAQNQLIAKLITILGLKTK